MPVLSAVRKRNVHAFTLFEVMLGMTIMVIMVAGIYGTVQAVIQAAGIVQTQQKIQTSKEALVELLRKNFLELPEKSIALLEVRQGKPGYLSELYLEDAPAAFQWGENGGHPGVTVLSLENRSDGSLAFGIRRIDRDESNRSREQAGWISLVDDLRLFRWEFFDLRKQKWLGKWDDKNTRPDLIRLTMQFQGENEPMTVTFQLPWTRPAKTSAKK